jgi:hypothetical protein
MSSQSCIVLVNIAFAVLFPANVSTANRER